MRRTENDLRRACLLVHGIWDSAERIEPLRKGLQARGVVNLVAIDLKPNDGRVSILTLAEQVADLCQIVSPDPKEPIDLVGFSMGALVSRAFIQRRGGKERVRRFVSISGPHKGTLTAFAMPHEGVRQMRPNSAFLRDLGSDSDPWGSVEVHSVITPFDLMIVPATSGILDRSASVKRVPVPMHRFMISDRRVLDHVAALLKA